MQTRARTAAAATAKASWFARLFGFEEATGEWERPRSMLEWDAAAGVLTSRRSGESFGVGSFATPSVGELRRGLMGVDALTSLHVGAEAAARPSSNGTVSVEHRVTADALALHQANPLATIQAASQFNCLEFPSPDCTPEDGVTMYAYDPTQGPACALACAPATVVRNYFGVDGSGQTRERQIDNLASLAAALRPHPHEHEYEPLGGGAGGREGLHTYWDVRNGYTFSSAERLRALNAELERRHASRDELVQLVRVGVHSHVETVFANRSFSPLPPGERSRVTQVFASALSVAYSGVLPHTLWEPLARIALEGAYEATLLAAAGERVRGVGSGVCFLTLLGGGVFGNELEWILESMSRALARTRATLAAVNALHRGPRVALDVVVAHHSRLNPRVVEAVQ